MLTSPGGRGNNVKNLATGPGIRPKTLNNILVVI